MIISSTFVMFFGERSINFPLQKGQPFYRAIASIVMIDVVALLLFIISIKINRLKNVHLQSRANMLLN